MQSNEIPSWLLPVENNIDVYRRLGWKLVRVPKGSKSPNHKEWNLIENCIVPDKWQGNIGLALAYSTIVSIDIDNWLKATVWLKERGIALQKVYTAPNAVTITSGKQGHGKLLYKLPEGIKPLESQKINDDRECILEFRCATKEGKTVQDLIYPSTHPETKQPYQWGVPEGGDLYDYLNGMPELPTSLLTVWNELMGHQNSIQTATPSINHDWQEVEQAIAVIPAICSRDDWIKTGMALHHASVSSGNLEYGLHVWNEWSKSAPDKYPNEREINKQWQSFKPDKSDGVTIATLFHIAKKYGYTKSINAEKLFSKIEPSIPKSNYSQEQTSKLSWTEGFILSKEEAEQISDPDWIYEDLIIQGHVIAIVAEPNGGKTTLLFHISAAIADAGYEVFYVNADVSGGDAKSMVFDAKEKGFTLMLPDMAGQTMESVVNNLSSMNDAGGEFSNVVFIFDTLKKMTEVINKSKAKELYQLLRSLSAKGMTIILLAHTNKYKDADGNPVFEGTGDLRADVDELIYLIPEKRADGSMVISTKPDKVRGAFKPISFEVTASRQVKSLNDYVDTALSRKEKEQVEKDAILIELITESIKSGKLKQKDIVSHCKNNDIGWRSCEAVLKRYMKGNMHGFVPLWTRERTYENNAWNYHLLRESAPTFPVVNVKSGAGGDSGETDL